MLLRLILRGVASFLRPSRVRLGTGGSQSARYCYGLWMRHLLKASEQGLEVNPRVVMELGPGDSLGAGLCALLCGAERLVALDAAPHSQLQRNLVIFDELIALLTQRCPIPDEQEWPRLRPRLSNHRFPSEILTDARLRETLRPSRLEKIRRALTQPGPGDQSMISYHAPWNSSVMPADSVDWIFSQAVLEHIDDLPALYLQMARWLRPGGQMSHEIDFKCHGLTPQWNGHWSIAALSWRLIRGRRLYHLNREPLSSHLHLLVANGLSLCHLDANRVKSTLSRSQLALRFRHLSIEDLTTSEAFLLAVKEQSAPQ